MKKYMLLFICLFSVRPAQTSEEQPKEWHGFSAIFNQSNGASHVSESCWSVMTVPYKKGGITLSYNLILPSPPVVMITPISNSTMQLKHITPLVIDNTVTELTIVTTVTNLAGLIREADDGEVTLSILAIYPNDQINDLIVTPGLGLGSFDFGGS